MKKVAILAVLALTAPLFAGTVTVAGADLGGGKLGLTYTGDNPLGLALVLDPDAAGAVAGYVAGSTDSFFDVFMDYASTQVPTPGYTLGTGHPLATTGAAGVPTLPLAAGAPVAVCVGHLAAANGGTGKIATVQFTLTAACHVGIAADTFRGSAADAAGAMTVNITTPDVLLAGAAPECVKTSAPFYNDWVAQGKPNCWCYSRNCRGDINGVKTLAGVWVSSTDLNLFKAAYNQAVLPAGGICADNNRAKTLAGVWVSSTDLNNFKLYYGKAEVDVPVCDQTNYNFWVTP